MGAYSKNKIMGLIKDKNLIDSCIECKKQVTSNGIDMTLGKVEEFTSHGLVDFSNEERIISKCRELPFEKNGWVYLPQGTYKITYNEIVNIPQNTIAIARTRSTLLRCGATIETGVWDAGYRGRSSSMLHVANKHGIKLKKNARVLQLVFFDLDAETERYSGAYQNENMDD
ncbi:MAG: deoxyuridine 5'-triphosphate nucleotidohydrolase [Candidatus Methanofastidiosia archaeon]